MQAMILDAPRTPLRNVEISCPMPSANQILLRVLACGVCRTDLHIVDGDLADPKLPIIPGHEIVGEVIEQGDLVQGFGRGDRAGVAWLGETCNKCSYCRSGRENLCIEARFTGYTLDGGYAEYVLADYRYCFPIPSIYSDAQAAPLLCAGLIGYRSLKMAGEGKRLGIYGFGAAAHIITQVACYQGREVYAFTRPGDNESQLFARQLGVTWAGSSTEDSPISLDAAILFAPVGSLVPIALKSVIKGGIVVCAGIHMSDIPRFPYSLLWGERCLRSVANLTRRDGEEFLVLAPQIPIRTEVQIFPLSQANTALEQLRNGKIQGAAVLVPL